MKRDASDLSPGEQQDKNFDALAVTRMAAALVVILILCCVVSAGYFFFLAGWTEHRIGPILSPLPESERAFPPPQIQANPKEDYLIYHQAMEERLNEYRWIDQEKGIVAIPIDRAMELTLERGLPYGREAAGGTVGPTWEEMLQSRAKEGKKTLP